jgi:phosphoribosylaminoimidazolecarboxamide formyltransferase/IMP cyclohydrolase
MKIRTALLSVANKDGIVEFARELRALGFTSMASGGTGEYLQASDDALKERIKEIKAGCEKHELPGHECREVENLASSLVNSMKVESLTGVPPALGHQVVTLHHKIHGGLMATPAMLNELQEAPIFGRWIDLVYVGLYPMEAMIATPGATPEMVREKTDIGGPALLRSASKGRRIVLCKPGQCEEVLAWLHAGEPDSERFRLKLAAAAERHVADYVTASARYLESLAE